MRRRPSRLWLFFWGRKRRGYPGLLTAVIVLAVLGALSLRAPHGYDVGYWAGVALILLLVAVTVVALAAVLYGVLRPRGRR